MSQFIRIWIGQLVSALGSGLTSFGLALWVYQRSGSIAEFAMLQFFTAASATCANLVAGPMVDRVDRRRMMMACDAVGALTILSLSLSIVLGHLSLGGAYAIASILSVCTAFRWLAYSAITMLTVERANLGRANGFIQMSEAVAQILPPLIAGLMIASVGLSGLALIDFLTYVFAFVVLLLVPLTRVVQSNQMAVPSLSFVEFAFGWRYIRANAGLLGLLMYFALINFLVGIAAPLFSPMVLSFSSPRSLGAVLAAGGCGVLLGSLLMSACTSLGRRVMTVFVFGSIGGIGIVVSGLLPSARLIGAGIFIFFFCFPIVNAATQAIWQRKVELAIQGRVFAVRRTIAALLAPLSYVLAGPLVNYVFTPLTQRVGFTPQYAPHFQSGAALLVLVVGCTVVLTNVFAAASFRGSRLEPDPVDAYSSGASVMAATPILRKTAPNATERVPWSKL